MISRNDVIIKINERLRSQISDAAIAAWAFDLFYSIEQGEEEVDTESCDGITDALDELMFADEKPFALDDADLYRLITRLE